MAADGNELLYRLSALWNIEKTERDKAIKLLFKIFNKIISNPSEPKYGDLNFAKIRQKFEHCRPGFYLLYDSGFKQSTNGLRLQWIHSNENYNLLKKVNASLHQKCKDPNSMIPKQKINTKTEESAETKHRRQIQQKLKQKNSEKEKKRKLIKEKIAMQRKEQKIEQRHLLQKVKESKERQKRDAMMNIKEQFTMTMEAMMNDMMKSMMQQNENECKQDNSMPSEYKPSHSSGIYGLYTLNNIQYDQDVVNNLCSLGVGTREQCIKASGMAVNYKDECSVVDALEMMQNKEQVLDIDVS